MNKIIQLLLYSKDCVHINERHREMGRYFIDLTAGEMTFCSTYGKTTQNRPQEYTDHLQKT
jgi:hypothetical protein